MRYNVIFLLGLVILCLSCDPISYDSYIVDNKSDFEIEVKFTLYQGTTYQIDSVVRVPSNEELSFFNSSGYADCPSDLGERFLYYFDTTFIEINDKLELIKEFQLRENWEYIEKEGEGLTCGGYCEYHFYITNDDLIKND